MGIMTIKRAIRAKFDHPETSLFECECLIQECKIIGLTELAEEMEKDFEFEVKHATDYETDENGNLLSCCGEILNTDVMICPVCGEHN